MAIITPDIWMEATNTYLTGTAYTQLGSICVSVDQSIKKYLQRDLEQTVYTNMILDAPRVPVIQLARFTPITVSTFQLYLNWQAYGNPAAFGPSALQQPYVNYVLEADRGNPLISSSGVVRNLFFGPWGIAYQRPAYGLASQRVNVPGAIMVNFTGGYTSVPTDIVLAATLAVSKIRQMILLGVPKISESWNGYSASGIGSLWLDGILQDPTIRALLNPYLAYSETIG